VASFLVSTGAARAEDSQWTVNQVLKQIDKANKEFRSMTAQIKVEHVVPGETETHAVTGKVWVDVRNGMRVDFTDPEKSTLLCTYTDLYVYKPDEATLEQIRLAKSPDRIEQYMQLGFTLWGTALQKDYLVTLVGKDPVGDRSGLLLELTPKSDAIRARISKIRLWIDQATWLPIQQEIAYAGPGNKGRALYTGAARNVSIDKSLFKPKWPKGTTKIKR